MILVALLGVTTFEWVSLGIHAIPVHPCHLDCVAPYDAVFMASKQGRDQFAFKLRVT
jgi:hypothetical protein